MSGKKILNKYADEKWGYYLEGLHESIDSENYVIGIYYVAIASRIDPWYIGRVIVKEQTIGSYFPAHSNPKNILRRFAGKVIGVYEVPPYEIGFPDELKERQYIIQVAYPIEGLDNQFPLLLTTLMGNISLGGKVKLLDVCFPQKYLKDFQGPKFGIEGIRKLLKIPNRPILTNINHAYTLEDGANLFHEAAMGGADFIKDNENLAGDVKYLPIEDRVPKYMEIRDTILSEMIRKITGKPSTLNRYRVLKFARDRLFDDSKIREELGFYPICTPDETISRTVELLLERELVS